jgi:hypothetical protein
MEHQFSSVQFSSVQFSAVQFSSVQCSSVQFSSVTVQFIGLSVYSEIIHSFTAITLRVLYLTGDEFHNNLVNKTGNVRVI